MNEDMNDNQSIINQSMVGRRKEGMNQCIHPYIQHLKVNR